MLDKAIVKHCSPTLAGLKTGSIFTVRSQEADLEILYGEIRELNPMLNRKGLRIIPLRNNGQGTLVYLYRPEHLKKDLMCPEAESILQERKYPSCDPDKCIRKLIGNLKSKQDFPHEIGLFLGYPPCDVKGFIQDSRQGVKCVGCWKVYGDQQAAEKIFAKYKKCTEVYSRKLLEGRSLEKLVVETPEHRKRKVS